MLGVIFAWCSLAAVSGVLILGSSVYLYLGPALPSVITLKDIRLQTPLRIFSSDGKFMAEFGEKRRMPIMYSDLSENIISAFLAAEDDRFYFHNGVDVTSLLRAAFQLVSTGKIQSGGSTITMQVAKNFFLSHERVFSRKFNEILLALEIERKLTKIEILELYLNKIYLGNRSYGVEAASYVYYGKSINELNISQIAMIAGLPKAPSKYNPIVNPKRALIRRNWIIKRMLDLGYISDEEATDAIGQPVTAKYYGLQIELEAPYAAEMVRQEIVEALGLDAYSDGYEVYTTIDSNNQLEANNAVIKGIFTYDERHGYRGVEAKTGDDPLIWKMLLKDAKPISQLIPGIIISVEDEFLLVLIDDETIKIAWQDMPWLKSYVTVNRQNKKPDTPHSMFDVGDLIRVKKKEDDTYVLSQVPEVQGALVALDPQNGAINALVGGFDFYESKYNRATHGSRQIGSAFKPFIYSAAIDGGMTAATLINDAPVVFTDDQLEDYWRPQNDNMKFYGPTRLRKGLYRSRNLVSIRVLKRTGVRETLKYLVGLGLPEKKLPRNLSLALGSADLTPLELSTGYATLANGGFSVSPYIIERIDRLNTTLYKANPETVVDDNNHSNSNSVENDTLEDDTNDETLHVTPIMASKLKDIKKQGEDLLFSDNINYGDMRKADRVMDARVNYIINSILRDVITLGTGRRARALNRKDIAGKTGTTNEQKDVWFAGYTPKMLATVWLGFDRPKPLGQWEYAATTALPIWLDFMKSALKNIPETYLPQPNGITTLRINSQTGKPTTTSDPDSMFEIFRTEMVPSIEQSNEPFTPEDTDSYNSDDIL